MIKYFRIGKIISLHGIKGEVKIFSTSDELKRYDTLKTFYMNKAEEADDDEVSASECFEVESVKYVKQNPILKIKGYDSIESSTKLIGQNLFVKREDAIKLKENEFYAVDLISLKVYVSGNVFGTVKDILKTKANDILVVEKDGKEILIPLVYDFIDSIDVKSGTINVKTVEGLL